MANKRRSGNSDLILFSWAPKITTDSDCNHEIKRCLLLERKAMTNLDSVLKNRAITLNIHWKDWCWSSNTLATWYKGSALWKRHWCWERLKANGEEGSKGWDGWIASLIQWTWTWANSRRWWEAGRPGMLQSVWSQRAGHDLVTEQRQHNILFLSFAK